MGYFIEEAKDHLNTIEQGLLNLQATISDAEMANEVFRAAHSVKGGAAMLGLDSIQTTAHRMEDYFKILKESPVQVDRALETMFLQVFDGLQDLLDQLQGPFGLSDDKAQEIMAGVEPVFGQISTHLDQLVADGGATPESVSSQPVAAAGSAVKGRPDQVLVGQAGEQSALVLMFKSNVPGHLRDMLNLFKQGDTDQTRQQLQDLCDTLRRIGEQFDLEAWCDLAKSAQVAIANPENGYRALAPIVITDLKAGQDLVSAGREPEVSISDRLQAMLPEDALELDSSSELDALLEEATDGLADDGTLADPDLESLFGADGVGESEEFDLGDLSDLDDGQNDEAAVSPEAASETNGSSGDDDFDALFGDTDLSALDEPEAGSMPA
ncbi:MAG: Hpt domain-containing protein, partial [Cyanobacteria bacterium P01_C01_bin.73]